MTTKRWIDGTSDATELERAVLASGLDADPPPGAEQAVWQGLAAALAVLPPIDAGAALPSATVPAPVAATTLSGGATLVTLGKGFVLGVGVSLAAAGVGRFSQAPAPDTTPVASSMPVRAKPPTTARALEIDPLREPPRPPERASVPDSSSAGRTTSAPPPATARGTAAPPAAPRVAGSSSAAFPEGEKAAAPRASSLEEEAALLRRARSELLAGRLAQAFATLEASREKFSLPELAQEREALLIELLYRSGQRARAIEKARSFLARYPESPHAAKVRSIAAAR